MGFLFAPPAAENPAPTISYASPQTYPEDVAISTLSPTTANATSFADITGLPTGLSLNTSNGDITGTPTVVASAANYTIRATGPGGTADAVINITITAVVAGATVTILSAAESRMIPHPIHAQATASVLGAGTMQTARIQWTVTGPPGWVSPTCTDPRPGASNNADGTSISLATQCEGFNHCVVGDVAGTYNIKATITDEDGTTYQDDVDVVLVADTRTVLYVSGTQTGTGDGSIGDPLRQPAEAWDAILLGGKDAYTMRLERGYQYEGMVNNEGGDTGATNMWMNAYGSGALPILEAEIGKLVLTAWSDCENVVLQDLNFRGDASDNARGIAVQLQRSKNVALIDCQFGGANDTDNLLSAGVSTNADDDAVTPRTTQNVGIAMFGCTGYTEAYTLYCDMPEVKGKIDDAFVTPTTTQCEVLNGRLHTADGHYVGRNAVALSDGAADNEIREITGYIYDNGNGNALFTVSPAWSAALIDNTIDILHIEEFCEVGDSEIFLFGCDFDPTTNNSEVRIRVMNGTRFTAVGMDVTAGGKSGFRLMVDYVTLYRSAEFSGGAQIGVDTAAGGLGPHLYNVVDRSYLSSSDTAQKVAASIVWVEKALIRGSVLKGGYVLANGGGLINTHDKNTGIGLTDLRIIHSTLLHKRTAGEMWKMRTDAGDTVSWLTAEHNLFVRDGSSTYHAFIDNGAGNSSAYKKCDGNLYCPDPAPSDPFRVGGTYEDLVAWQAETFTSNEDHGTEDPDDLVTNDFVPQTTQAKTHRGSTAKGVYQDYYGRDPTGEAYVGAVSQAVV